MAPTRAPKTTCVSTMPGWTIPLPTVAATLRWKTKTATTLKKAAKATACVGLSTPVETTVAIELAASWKPFMKSNSKGDRKSTRLNSSHLVISYAVFCLKKKKEYTHHEVVPSQNEIDMSFSYGLEIADNTMTYIISINEVALEQSHYATLMRKLL